MMLIKGSTMPEKTRKRTYKKGMIFFHKETKKKVVFGKWNDDNTAACITEDKLFLNIPRKEMDENYGSYAQLEREARERRRGQTW